MGSRFSDTQNSVRIVTIQLIVCYSLLAHLIENLSLPLIHHFPALKMGSIMPQSVTAELDRFETPVLEMPSSTQP